MGFKDVESSFATPWTPAKKGEKLEGIYMGSEEVPSPQKAGETFTSYKIRVGEGEESRYMGVAGAMLASKFNQVPHGSLVQLEYNGILDLKGGNKAKDYILRLDDSVTKLDPFVTGGHTGEIDI